MLGQLRCGNLRLLPGVLADQGGRKGKEYREQRAARPGISRPHQFPASPSLAPLPEGAWASQNSATCWRLTIQTHEPVGDFYVQTFTLFLCVCLNLVVGLVRSGYF